MPNALVILFQQELADLCPDWRNKRFLIAFSGGLDSTALLNLMAESLPVQTLAAAHLNHCLRGRAAQTDQLQAAAEADRLKINFITITFNVNELAQSRKKGIEEAARTARYDFLKEAAVSWKADFILTAHQADDQAETILLNLIKGAGGGGLAGIPARRNLGGLEILRPLLPFARNQLETWLTGKKITWSTDHSNFDHCYRRNDLRLNVMPLLKKINPKLNEAFGRAAAIMRAEEEFWAEHVARLFSKAASRQGETVIVSRPFLNALSQAEKRRLIYAALLEVRRGFLRVWEPLSMASVETVLSMLKQKRHKGLDLPGGLRAESTPLALCLSPASRLCLNHP